MPFSSQESSLLDCMHLDLDGAWPRDVLPDVRDSDCRHWGRRLRFSATRSGIEHFYKFSQRREARFRLFGSGDYHHLTALWLRRLQRPFQLLSFDNHPDWDRRPPYWCCGTWINRALELPFLKRASIWGCGNFEFHRPNVWFANHRAIQAQRLQVWPWTVRLNPRAQKEWTGLQRDTWRTRFKAYAREIEGEDVYITVDIDAIRSEEAVTNWENGLFTATDIAWAIGEVRAQANVVGGDLCGAYSPPKYARLKQRIESYIDHPRLPSVPEMTANERNLQTLRTIWPVLSHGNQHNTCANEAHAHP